MRTASGVDGIAKDQLRKQKWCRSGAIFVCRRPANLFIESIRFILGNARRARELSNLFAAWRRVCNLQDRETMAVARRAIDAGNRRQDAKQCRHAGDQELFSLTAGTQSVA